MCDEMSARFMLHRYFMLVQNALALPSQVTTQKPHYADAPKNTKVCIATSK
jgi:hypothetical protein